MNDDQRRRIEKVLDNALDMVIATNRPDGYPQATTVAFIHDELTLYFGCHDTSQKADNIRLDPRVSGVINRPYSSWADIYGVSFAGLAAFVEDPGEIAKTGRLLKEKFPDIGNFLSHATAQEDSALIRIDLKIVSLLDYQRGFGNTELIELL